MKKIITLLIGLTLTLPLVASAATFVVTSGSVKYKTGDIITVNISVNPAPSTSYTAMLDASFSTDTLEVVSFSMNDKMLAIKQAGYDAIDNANGLLIKTGGYPGGINSVTPFGTLVLRAKKEGVGTLTINDNSKLLNANNVDEQIGSQTLSFNIEKYIPLPTAKPKVLGSATSTETTSGITATSEISKALESVSKNNLLVLVAILLLVIIGLATAYFVKSRKIN